MADPAPDRATNDAPARQRRLIKRYTNRKLYDTEAGELTSLRRVEELVRDGADILVIDHDTGDDITGETLTSILSASDGLGSDEIDIALLLSLIRSPRDVLASIVAGERRDEQLRAMNQRVRLLSATIDALLDDVDDAEVSDG